MPAPLAGLHDLELAQLAGAGARDAFGELVRRHGSAVRGLLRRMGADPATADDLAQDAFIAAYEHIASFRGQGSFGGWIKRIAARAYIRRARGRLRLEQPLEDEHDEGHGGEGEAVLRLDLDEALKALTPVERVCVTLCHGAGFSHGEAAEALNAPLGTVKSHVKRGLDKLRRRLGADAAGRTIGG